MSTISEGEWASIANDLRLQVDGLEMMLMHGTDGIPIETLFLLENRIRTQADHISSELRQRVHPSAYAANPH